MNNTKAFNKITNLFKVDTERGIFGKHNISTAASREYVDKTRWANSIINSMLRSVRATIGNDAW